MLWFSGTFQTMPLLRDLYAGIQEWRREVPCMPLIPSFFFCSKEHAILIDNYRAIPVYLIHKTDKIADMQVN